MARMFDDPAQVAYLIDQTLLKPEAGKIDYADFIQRNSNSGFHTMFVPPIYLESCVKILGESKTLAGGIAGFPFGWETTEDKLNQLKQALATGADEIDFVVNVSMLKSGERDFLSGEFAALRGEADKHKNKFGDKIILKCIIECCLLTDDEKRLAVELLINEGIDFVKTSTGFNKWGAKVEDVKLLVDAGGGSIKVKASGGIRTSEDMMALVAAGASRIGTSAGAEILGELH